MVEGWLRMVLSCHGVPAEECRLSVTLAHTWSRVSFRKRVKGNPAQKISFKCRTDLADALLAAIGAFGFWSIGGYATNDQVYDGAELALSAYRAERGSHSVHLANPGAGAPQDVRDLFEFGCSVLSAASAQSTFVDFLDRLREPDAVEWFKKHWVLP